LRLAEGNEVVFALDEFALFLREGLFVVDPVREGLVVAGGGSFEGGEAFASYYQFI
jgi:hypothetical protein